MAFDIDTAFVPICVPVQTTDSDHTEIPLDGDYTIGGNPPIVGVKVSGETPELLNFLDDMCGDD